MGNTKISSLLGGNMAMFIYVTRVKYPIPPLDDLKGSTSCFMCEAKPAWISSLTHCRLCGHFFCSRCVDKFTLPKRYLADPGSSKETGKVCYGCEAICRFGADLDIAGNFKLTPNHAYPPTVTDLVISVPKWANMANYKSCHKCSKESKQGHNCRLCGCLFCDKCTSKMSVPLGYDKKNKKGDARVCDRCRFLKLAGAQYAPPAEKVQTETSVMLGELGHLADDLSREFIDKLRKAACVGCDSNFHLLNKRHTCPYCRLSWCSGCLPAHLKKEAEDSKKKERAADRNKRKGPSNLKASPLAPGLIVPSTQVAADNLLALSANSQVRNAHRIRQEDSMPYAAKLRAENDKKGLDDSNDKKQSGEPASPTPAASGEPDAADEKKAAEQKGPGFEILCRLGEGSYGAVYKATDARDGKLVAIKVIEDQAENVEALLKEIAFLEACKNDHIVQYKGTYQMMAQTCIAMEYMCGGSLNDIMEVCDKTFEEEEIAVVMREALYGLHYLHSNNKIHRDIKSGNILVNELGECKLADFGVSCEVESQAERRRTIIGTPYWMAPEVLQAKDKGGYDSKSDIWSLGITAMELAKGVPPHSDMHPMRVIFKIPHVAAPKLPDPDNWSQAFMDFIAACLTKDFNVRPSAEELLKHKFITGAGPIKIMADLVSRSMTDIDQFRKQEAVEAKSEEELLTAKEDGNDPDSESHVDSRSRGDTDSYGTADGNCFGTTLLDGLSNGHNSPDSYLPGRPCEDGATKKEKPKKEATFYGTTQVDTGWTPDADSYLGESSSKTEQADDGPAVYGTTVLDSNTYERAKDSYLAQVQSAAKAKYEAEAAAALAKEQAQEDGPQLLATVVNWQIIRDVLGRIYYNDTRTNTVTWEQPADLDGVVGLVTIISGAMPQNSSNDDDEASVTSTAPIPAAPSD
jgi:serine/threonine protein kinase